MSTSLPGLAREMMGALSAPGPWADYADKLMLFGQFVGAWDLDVTLFALDGTVLAQGPGEWLFGWTLEGRAIQDVLIRPPRAERARLKPSAPGSVAEFWEYGTTIRVYDPGIDAWRVTWIAPVQGREMSLIGRAQGNQIVLEGEAGELTVRWAFSEMSGDSCLWRGSASDDRGESWIVLQEMRMRRRPPMPDRG